MGSILFTHKNPRTQYQVFINLCKFINKLFKKSKKLFFSRYGNKISIQYSSRLLQRQFQEWQKTGSLEL